LQENWTSFKYLGIPICLQNLSCSSWTPLIDKIKSKFTLWGSQWLNLTGKVVLIKAVLSALPIFQFSSLLAPTSVKSTITQEIRKFLWQGGKNNNKRMHLVNWNTVRAPKIHGGLGIRDPTLSNIALGAKILWRLVIGKQEWWKKVPVQKYLEGDQLRCLDTTPPTQPGSPIWKLLKASLPLFQSKATWILGQW
jgi:hypothetical protein